MVQGARFGALKRYKQVGVGRDVRFSQRCYEDSSVSRWMVVEVSKNRDVFIFVLVVDVSKNRDVFIFVLVGLFDHEVEGGINGEKTGGTASHAG
jgi:hypothetical protein